MTQGETLQAEGAGALDAEQIAAARARVQHLMAVARLPHTQEERETLLDELMVLSATLSGVDEAGASDAEVAFLLILRDEPSVLENLEYRTFVAQCIDRESLQRIAWHTVEEVIEVAEVLYGFRYQDELPPDQLTAHVRDLVRDALKQFERNGEPEKMFDLLQRAPIPPHLMDAELVRLRNSLHLYEMRRVTTKQRKLYGFLLLQILLVLLIFPLLFQNFENGAIQNQVEAATGLEIVDGQVRCETTIEGTECEPPHQFFSLWDSVYWSVITYASIGYGDITPVTVEGKLLAGIHGIMGVLTTGIIAGLVLNWLTPRDLR